MTVELSTVTWEATGWDDPRVEVLRQEMNVEIGPRYTRPDGSRNPYPPPPEPAEILVSWLAVVDGRSGGHRESATVGRGR